MPRFLRSALAAASVTLLTLAGVLTAVPAAAALPDGAITVTSPTTFEEGYLDAPITFTGSGFTPNTSVSVTLMVADDQTAPHPLAGYGAWADSAGNIAGSYSAQGWLIPATGGEQNSRVYLVASEGFGDNQVRVSNQVDLTVTERVMLAAATIVVPKTSVVPGPDWGEGIAFTGSGWSPNTTVYLMLEKQISDISGTGDLLEVVSDGNGNISDVINPAADSDISSPVAPDEDGYPKYRLYGREGSFGEPVRESNSVDITVAVEQEPPTYSFVDVPSSFAYYTQIQWLAGERISTGWLEGDGTRTYRPGQPVNRDAMAAFMYRLAGSPSFPPPVNSPFRDVRTDHPFYKEITWLADKRITTGYPEAQGLPTWRGMDPVSRDAMALFMYRYSETPALNVPVVSPFTDVQPTHPSYRALVWMNSNGITTGFDDGGGKRSYRGIEGVYRDSMAAFMYRLTHNPMPPASPGDTKNCNNFAAWHQANGWYATYFPYHGDIGKLDLNNDGIVCEALPGRS